MMRQLRSRELVKRVSKREREWDTTGLKPWQALKQAKEKKPAALRK